MKVTFELFLKEFIIIHFRKETMDKGLSLWIEGFKKEYVDISFTIFGKSLISPNMKALEVINLLPEHHKKIFLKRINDLNFFKYMKDFLRNHLRIYGTENDDFAIKVVKILNELFS
ncbi:DNA methyltransferase [Fusobacterium necrophorum subsp. funduliforme]|uniref:hypothetical protein n=1 Tax=Fusobacterium necrophorum TaxID=859 RepID=UPI00370F1C4B